MLVNLEYIPDHPRESQSITSEELAEIEGTDDLEKDERRLSDQCQEKVRSLEKVKLHQGAVVQEIGKKEKQSFWQILAIPAVWQTFLCFFFFDITLWGFLSWLPTYLVKARGFDLTHMGLNASLPFFAGTASMIFFGWLSDRYFNQNRKVPVMVTQLLGAACLYFMQTAVTMQDVVVYETLAGTFLLGCFGALMALPMGTIQKEVAGRAMGVVNMGGQIAGFLSPIILGYLVQEAGGFFDSAFMCLIVAVLVSFFVALFI